MTALDEIRQRVEAAIVNAAIAADDESYLRDESYMPQELRDAKTLLAALDAVLELHESLEDTVDCMPNFCQPCRVEYPCPTVQAITAHLGEKP